MPTVPREAQGKNRNFKNWRSSEQESNSKVNREVNKPISSNKQANKKSPLSNDRHSKLSKRSQKSKEIDLDAEE